MAILFEQCHIPFFIHSLHDFTELGNGQIFVKAKIVKDNANIFPCTRGNSRRGAEDGNFAPLNINQIENGFYGCRFACAIFTNQANDTSLRNAKRYVMQTKTSIFFLQILNFYG